MRTPGKTGRKVSVANAKLPERPSLEHLKKLAKNRLRELRRKEPKAKLTVAQLAVAREYGFTSWRALKAQLDERQAKKVASPVMRFCMSLTLAEAWRFIVACWGFRFAGMKAVWRR
jgi:hypothetical protein